MDKDKKKDDIEKAGSSQEPEDKKRGAVTVSNTNSSIDFLVNQARKSRHYLGKRVKQLPKQKKKKRATGRVQKRRTRRRRKPRPRYIPRTLSSDTSFSSKNTLSIRHAVTCRYCGHRCCLRRYR